MRSSVESLAQQCSLAPSCLDCSERLGCVWCAASNQCTQEAQCTTPVTVCPGTCVHFVSFLS
jgi:hypothetical protein